MRIEKVADGYSGKVVLTMYGRRYPSLATRDLTDSLPRLKPGYGQVYIQAELGLFETEA